MKSLNTHIALYVTKRHTRLKCSRGIQTRGLVITRHKLCYCANSTNASLKNINTYVAFQVNGSSRFQQQVCNIAVAILDGEKQSMGASLNSGAIHFREKQTMKYDECQNVRKLTSLCKAKSAPSSKRMRTQSKCPLEAANIRGVVRS